jgi:Flp pilus assembly protein CpaB
MTDKSTRIRNLGVAGVLALVAAILTMLYVSRAQGSTSVQPVVGMAPVLVATQDLPIGTSITTALGTGAIAQKQVPTTAVAAEAISNTRLLRGQVVVQPIYKGEQITMRRFGSSGAQGLRTSLRGALRALAVSGDARQLLAGTLQQGDHVDVVVNDGGASGGAKTRIALKNLIVLQAPAAGEGTDTSLAATLQLTDTQVQVLWWVLKNGDWSFVLRPAAKATDTATRPSVRADVLAGR